MSLIECLIVSAPWRLTCMSGGMIREDIVIPALIAVWALTAPAAGQTQPAAIQPTAQESRGAAAFGERCAQCHGEDMYGGAGTPSLVGPEFKFGWSGKPVSDLFDYIHDKMPPGQTGSLTDQQYLDVVAAILRKNSEAADVAELTLGSDTLKMPIKIP